jgi:hypothetical protein
LKTPITTEPLRHLPTLLVLLAVFLAPLVAG